MKMRDTPSVPSLVLQMASDSNLISLFASAEPSVAQRLASPAMADAWNRLRSLSDGDDGFLGDYFCHALRLRQAWARMSRTPSGDIKKNVDDLARAAKSLRFQILGLQPDLRSHFGFIGLRDHLAMAKRLDRYVALLKKPPGLVNDMAFRPTKPRAESAERTFCVNALTDFLRDELGSTDHRVVADTVSAVLDLDSSQPLTANEVGKLVKGR